MLNISMKFIYASLIVLCLGIFTSISISGVSHILMTIAVVFFIANDPKKYWEALFRKKLLTYSLLAFIAAITLSVLFNWEELDRPLKNLSKIKYFLIPLLSVPVLSSFFKFDTDKKKTRTLLYIFLAATTVATISGIIAVYTGYNPLKFKAACHSNRACGLYGMYMTYGYGISLFMVLMTGALIYRDDLKENISSKFLVPIWLINFAGLILSYARGGILGFFFSVPFYFFKKSPKKFLIGFILLNLTLIATIAISPQLNKTFFDRSGSNKNRIAFYETALKAYQEKPIFGWGHKNLEPNMKALKVKYKIKYPTFGADAHNILLEVLATTGIIGIICFISFLLFWLREAYLFNTLVHRLSFPFVISLGISGQVQNTFGDGENLFLIMFVWSVLAAVPGERRVG